ncbi:MAG: M28 family peptidase [Anaerolineae bacterium]
MGWTVETQEFVFQGVRGRNIIGKAGQGPLVIIGAHYDTRPVADHDPDPANREQPILGANDGGSGVADGSKPGGPAAGSRGGGYGG